MKFDFIIGNPPYQENRDTNNKADPIYHHFYNSIEKMSDRYMLISPARFLFNAGLTPKEWNQKMLEDEHIKIIDYFPNSSMVFNNTNITGGIVIVYRDLNNKYQKIGTFVPYEGLKSLSERFQHFKYSNMSDMIYGGRSDLKFNDKFLTDFPDTKQYILKKLQEKHPQIKTLGPNEEYEIKSSSFERTPYAFVDTEPNDVENYYKILGIESGQRVFKWVKKEYLSPRFPKNNNISNFKIFISNADGAAGQIGKPIPARILGKPIIGEPFSSSIPTFMSIGNFETIKEAQNAEKYIKTKFVRVLIGIMKVSQHITPDTWKYVPLQDFSSNSDVDWTKSITEIDQQLYKKYDLDDKEIEFIESHVKEME